MQNRSIIGTETSTLNIWNYKILSILYVAQAWTEKGRLCWDVLQSLAQTGTICWYWCSSAGVKRYKTSDYRPLLHLQTATHCHKVKKFLKLITQMLNLSKAWTSLSAWTQINIKEIPGFYFPTATVFYFDQQKMQPSFIQVGWSGNCRAFLHW